MEKVLEKAKQWLSDAFDQNTRAQVQKLLDDNTTVSYTKITLPTTWQA